MRIIMDENYNYKSLEFCCTAMGELVMNNFVQSHPHTDHFPVFFIEIRNAEGTVFDDIRLNYCPYCGNIVRGEINSLK